MRNALRLSRGVGCRTLGRELVTGVTLLVIASVCRSGFLPSVFLLVGTDLLIQIPSPVIGAVVAVAVWKLAGFRGLLTRAGWSR